MRSLVNITQLKLLQMLGRPLHNGVLKLRNGSCRPKNRQTVLYDNGFDQAIGGGSTVIHVN